MLHAEQLEAIRRMTPEQRFEEWRALVRFCWKHWDVPDPEMGRRKWAAWERQHEEGNRRILEELRERDREPVP